MDRLKKRRKLLGAVSSLCSAAILASFAATASPLISPAAQFRSEAAAPPDAQAVALAECPAPETEEVASAFTASFASQDYPLFVFGKAYPFETLSVCGEYHVGASDLISFAGADAEVSAVRGERFFEVNGRCRPAFGGIVKDGTVPLFGLCAVLGLEASERGGAVFVTGDMEKTASGDGFYDGDDLFWLSRIIRAESETETLEGKIAVGNVVLNRVRSPSFPDDVRGVIFDRRGGVAQFSPASTDAIYIEPDSESVAAAKICLEGYSLSDEIIFFMNPALASSSWISDNRSAVMTIGNLTFYS